MIVDMDPTSGETLGPFRYIDRRMRQYRREKV